MKDMNFSLSRLLGIATLIKWSAGILVLCECTLVSALFIDHKGQYTVCCVCTYAWICNMHVCLWDGSSWVGFTVTLVHCPALFFDT